MLTIALSKGRIFDEALPMLAEIDIRPVADPHISRKLILPTNRKDVKIVIIRANDVPTYVEYGAADIGIAGKDVLMEYAGDGVYEPLDLGVARCKMMVAGPRDAKDVVGRLRVATKYVNTTRRYFAAKGIQVEIIRLYGSMELAPLMGLADRIVDLVDTGNTLRANNLVPMELIADISSWVIVNKASMKMKRARIKEVIQQLSQVVETRLMAYWPHDDAKT